VQSVSDDEEYQINSYKFGEQSVRMRQTSTHSISKKEKKEIKTKNNICWKEAPAVKIPANKPRIKNNHLRVMRRGTLDKSKFASMKKSFFDLEKSARY